LKIIAAPLPNLSLINSFIDVKLETRINAAGLKMEATPYGPAYNDYVLG
jgi:hypothetical protein